MFVEFRMEGKRARVVAIDHLSQFLESAIHSFLRARAIYPRESFVKRKRLGLTVWSCEIARKYVSTFVKSLSQALLVDRVNAIIIRLATERFVIEIPADFSRNVFYANPSISNRTDLDISCLCVDVLSESLGAIERRLAMCPPRTRSDLSEWELFVDVKPIQPGADSIDVPIGSTVVSPQEEVFFRDASHFVRYPLKSSVLNEQVLVAAYVDIHR